MYHQYNAKKATSTAAKRKTNDDSSATEASTSKGFTQNPIDVQLRQQPVKVKPITQDEFNKELLNMIVEDMQPLASVERTGFKKFCARIAPQVQIPSRRTLARYTEELYCKEKEKLIATLDKVKHVSVTVDLWSSHKRGFLGMTVHYIDEATLKRESHVLTCRRMKHAHTGEVIAKIMTDIFDEFHILSKVTTCVTDNATNMIKAFTFLCTKQNTEPSNFDETDESADNDEIEEFPVEVENLQDMFRQDDPVIDVDLINMFRKQVRCTNHTLNLVASVDSLSARKDDKFKRLYDRAMGKVQALSNSVSRSTKHADAVEEITGVTFLNPTCTRWMSDYTAVRRVVEVGLVKVRECETKLGLAVMNDAEITFLKAYLQIFKPFAIAMDLLQREEDCFLGHVIPTVIGIQNKLQSIAADTDSKPLISALLEGLQSRFRPVFDDDQMHIATMLVPKFKLNYLPPESHHEKKMLLTHAIYALHSEVKRSSSGERIGQSSATTSISQLQLKR